MKFAAFFHGKLIGPEFGIDPQYSRLVVSQQMQIMDTCGLTKAASYICCGFNDDQNTVNAIRGLLPEKAVVVAHGTHARSELPTMRLMQDWINKNPVDYVMYGHSKGITHPKDPLCEAWRACMQKAVLWNWKKCVIALTAGFDSCGAHWLTREEHGPKVNTFFWGGNFWWSTAAFLKTLPQLPSNSQSREQDFLAETWIGTGRRPRVRDFALPHHWPGLIPCTTSLQRT